MRGDTLKLQNPMQQSYLIQRLRKPIYREVDGKKIDNPFSFGGGFKNGGLSDQVMDILREILSFDYMGSAEFEFGAVPAALAFLAEQAVKKNLVYGEVEGVYYICPVPYKEEVEKRIVGFKAEERWGKTKERVGLHDAFSKPDRDPDLQGWLELDNGYVFFVNKEMYEKFTSFLGMFKK